MNKIVEFFTKHSFYKGKDEKLKLVITISLVVFLMDFAFVPPLLFFGMNIGVLSLVLSSLIGIGGLFYLKSSGNIIVQSEIMNTTVYFRILSLILLSNGFDSTAILFFTFLPLFAILISNKISGIFWGTISALSILGFGLLATNGHQFTVEYKPEFKELITMFFAVASPILITVLALVFVGLSSKIKTELVESKRMLSQKLMKLLAN